MLSKLLVNTHHATCIQSSTQHVKTIFIYTYIGNRANKCNCTAVTRSSVFAFSRHYRFDDAAFCPLKKCSTGGRLPRNRDIARKFSGPNFRCVQSFPQTKDDIPAGIWAKALRRFNTAPQRQLLLGLNE